MSFVTTVTCARNIKDDYPSFFYIRGDFASKHVARVSDNGDRIRSSIKTEINTLAKANPLGRCLASGVPAMDCGWENLPLPESYTGCIKQKGKYKKQNQYFQITNRPLGSSGIQILMHLKELFVGWQAISPTFKHLRCQFFVLFKGFFMFFIKKPVNYNNYSATNQCLKHSIIPYDCF